MNLRKEEENSRSSDLPPWLAVLFTVAMRGRISSFSLIGRAFRDEAVSLICRFSLARR
ncbi:hypothetical protein YC2023_061609 [Brassica napus]